MASCTTLFSGAMARVANITAPIKAPAVMIFSSIRNTPHTSMISVTACCAIMEMLLVQAPMLRDRSSDVAWLAVVSS